MDVKEYCIDVGHEEKGNMCVVTPLPFEVVTF